MFMKGSNRNATLFPPETHIKRRVTQHDCPSILLDDGDKGSGKVYGKEKIFCGPTRAAKARQKSLVPATRALWTNQGRRASFICTPWVPICLSFSGQQGPPHSSVSGCPYHNFSSLSFSSGRWKDLPVFTGKNSKVKTLQREAFYKNFILWYKGNYPVI